jgi:hypothetical protein
MNTPNIEQISQDGFIPDDIVKPIDFFPGIGLITNAYIEI